MPTVLPIISNNEDIRATSLPKNSQWLSDPSWSGPSTNSFLSLCAPGTMNCSWLIVLSLPFLCQKDLLVVFCPINWLYCLLWEPYPASSRQRCLPASHWTSSVSVLTGTTLSYDLIHLIQFNLNLMQLNTCNLMHVSPPPHNECFKAEKYNLLDRHSASGGAVHTTSNTNNKHHTVLGTRSLNRSPAQGHQKKSFP